MPENSGLAYVVIQHLDPTQKGMLPELLQRVCKMKVFQAKDRMDAKPNCVYLIPPNPASAKFDSMPRHAINSVMVDIVAPTNELPEKLLAFIKHLPRLNIRPGLEIKDKSAMEKIIFLLRSQTGNISQSSGRFKFKGMGCRLFCR